MADDVRFDPKIIPIDHIGDEPPIDSKRLDVDWIQNRFTNPSVTWTPEIFDELPVIPGLNLWVPSAVLIPIVARPDGVSLILTQRTSHLSHHGGQISFPGGRVDETDTSHIETALRETEEEVGLARKDVNVIGTLPEFRTGTGFIITPVVSIVHPPLEIKTDSFEVAEVFEVPLSFLMNGAHYQLRTAKFPHLESRRTFYTIPYGDRLIWGATAGILRNLFHFLRA